MLDDRRQRSIIGPDEWVRGAVNAPVTLLEYADFECPYCGAAWPVLEQLVHGYPDTIRHVFRHFPLTTMHPHALLAAESAEAAGAQDHFWDMHDMLFRHQQRLELGDLLRYAAAIGVDTESFHDDLRAHRYLPDVKADIRRGIQDGVNGTPTIFINGLRYDGPRTLPALVAAVATELHGAHP